MRTIAIALLLAVAGCAPATLQHTASLPERYYVAEAALHYFLKPQSTSEDDNFSAYIIVNSEFTPELVVSFRNYTPPVKANIDVSSEGGRVVEKATGKPVMLWSVKVEEVHGGRATAYVSWQSGNLAAGGHTIKLKRKRNGRWVVKSEKLDWIS